MKMYQNHRKKLMSVVTDALVFVASGEEKTRNNDVEYFFRQDSDFLYLTDITTPGYALALDPKTKKSHLFIPDISKTHQIWIGKQLTTAAAKKLFSVDFAHYISEFPKVIKALSKKYKKIHLLETGVTFLKKHGIKLSTKQDLLTLRSALNELRVRKSRDEIELMKTANAISNKGHIAAMKTLRPRMNEFQAQAVLEKEFLHGGAMHFAYPSIVASGKNAAILHYHDNGMRCEDGDLLLIDAGCEWHGYASDITRTFPVNGKFSQKQKAIYQIVLGAQKECIAMIRPKISILDLHMHACRSMTQGLMELGIFYQNDIEEIIKNEAHAIFFPHGIGHMLGLDVHDVGARAPGAKEVKNKPRNLRATRELEAGFVVTVEPGLYFIEAHFDSKETRKKTAKYINWSKADAYREVGGIRIEDDVLVTQNGFENLTTTPKEIRDIEALMS